MKANNLSELPANPELSGRLRGGVRFTALFASDLLAFGLAMVLCRASGDVNFLLLNPADSGQFGRLSVLVLLALAWLFWFGIIKKSYTQRKPFWSELWQILTGILVFSTLDAALSTLGEVEFSKSAWTRTWLLLLILLPCLREASRSILRYLNLWKTPTLIIGKGENAKEAYLALKSEPGMGFEVRAFVWPNHGKHADSARHFKTPIPGKPLTLFDYQVDTGEHLASFHWVVALEADEVQLRDFVIRQLSKMGITDVQVIPAMRGVPLYGMETSHFFSHEVLLIQLRNNLANPVHRFSKRVFDVVGSLSLMVLLSPLFALLAYKVSRDGGKPFFGHVRIGQNGEPFKCYKFRSMVVNAQEVLKHLLETCPVAQAEWAKDFKLKNDPRVSPLGDMLRRTSLDELPQLWNVLKGEMSLVGPRPVVHAELERYGDDVDYYMMAKPGMTGLWQVSGRNDLDYATRVYLDSWYVKNWSLWSDIAILFKTIAVVTSRNGAY